MDDGRKARVYQLYDEGELPEVAERVFLGDGAFRGRAVLSG